MLITFFGAQNLIPFFDHPDYAIDKIPEDMHKKISDGQLLNKNKIIKFNNTRVESKNISNKLSTILNIQQILAGIGYTLLFGASIPA